MKDLTIVVPVLNEELNIVPLYMKLIAVLKNITSNYEIIYVDDGSKDGTFTQLKELHKKEKNLKVISFRRNFGKAAALSAAFNMAEGKIVITMDGDLQDEPAEIPRFLEAMEKGYDMVTGWKTTKHKEGGFRRMPSLLFNKLASRLSGLKIHDFNCPFKAYKNEVVKELNLYGEMHRYIPALVHWNGYKIGEIKVLNYPRKFGKTKYSSSRILKGFLDLITVKYLMSYKNRPLHLFGTIGLLFTITGLLSGTYLFYQWLIGVGIGKRPLLMLSALMIMLGIQFCSIGLIGEMITNNAEKANKSYSIKEVLK